MGITGPEDKRKHLVTQYPSSSSREALKTLGQRLRELRVDAGLSGRELAGLTDWLPSKVSKIEHGKQTPSHQDIRLWCFHCRVPEQIPDFIASLRTVEGMYIEWRRMERTGMKRALEGTFPSHQRTKRFRIYSSWLVPGVLQTPDYTRTILSTLASRRGVPDDSEEAVKVRLKRQQFLRAGARQFAVVFEECVLHRAVLDPGLMRHQLEHILELSTLPRVSVGVIPRTADRRLMWAVESFWMFDEARVSVELVSGYLNITQPHEVRMYAQSFADLSAIALHGPQAREIITSALHSY